VTLQERWAELEKAAPRDPGHIRWLVPVDCAADVYIAVAEPSGCRVLALAFPSDVEVRPLLDLRLRGLEVSGAPFVVGSRGPTISIATRSREHNEIFARLADDVVGALHGLREPAGVVSATASRLAHWQRFLERASPEGLSPEAQAGLFGELWYLREHVIPVVGAHYGVKAWRGPEPGVQDFQLGRWAAEVKTSRQTAPASVRIANERQLQSTGIDVLGLVVVALEPRSGGIPTLVDAVKALRADLAQHTEASAQFEDLLIDAGYLDGHAHLYSDTSYAIRWAFCAIVRDGFPRLTEADLPDGVGEVSYGISIDALRPFVVDFADFAARVRGVSA
jgi:hypothetical protein